MNIKELLSYVDHTLLKTVATWEDIKAIADDGIRYGCASICIPPSYVERASRYAAGRVKICTVIGFPNGYNTTESKVFETRDAIAKGADEIDMVINIGLLKDKKYDAVQKEIEAIREATGDKVLKVIIETCDLTEEEKIKMCELVTTAGADFIKTSTGFSSSGATLPDVELFHKYVGEGVRIKAAGGISSLEDAENFVKAGATRLGTSRLVKIAKQQGI